MSGDDLSRLLEPLLPAFRDGITDIHVNPGGRVRLRGPRAAEVQISDTLDASRITRLCTLLAGDSLVEPDLSTELPAREPYRRARFQAALPPISESPSLSLRLHSRTLFTLDEHYRSVFSGPQLNRLHTALSSRHNILVVGGTGSGKTTLLNALLHKLAQIEPDSRILCLEDTRELVLSHEDANRLTTTDRADLARLVKISLRMRPDRIIVGEVRGGEALDLLDAWATGHPGGLSTLHADDAVGALSRLERLARRQAGQNVHLRDAIAAAVDLIVVLGPFAVAPRLLEFASLSSNLDEHGNYQLRHHT